MTVRPFGTTGWSTVPLALGTMHFAARTDHATASSIISAAVQAGLSIIDTADCYSDGVCEIMVGAIVRELGLRSRVRLASKCGIPWSQHTGGATYAAIITACEGSLRRLQTDCLDLFQLHRPFPQIPAEEIIRAWDDLQRAGKVQNVGTSSHPSWLIQDLRWTAIQAGMTPIVSEQPPYNCLDRRAERELLPLCQRHDLAVLPWSPLGGGILTGSYRNGIAADSRAAEKAAVRNRITPAANAVAQQIQTLAAERELTPAQFALLWVRDQPGVTAPILGPRTLDQLTTALVTLPLSLDADARTAVDALVAPGEHVSDFYNTVSASWLHAGRA